MKVLLTGGAGYIGSHTAVELAIAGHEITVVDNLSNSSKESIWRVEQLTGKKISLHVLDVRNRPELANVFDIETPEAVIHFAGHKAVGESVEIPLEYYDNNLNSTLTLMQIMQEKHVQKLIFSSSATVYGTPEELPLTEKSRVGSGITSPYGWTKFMIEQIIQDAAQANNALQSVILRYFNPVGAHESGLIGEDPSGIPNNLLPYISQVALGKQKRVGVFGNDYDTPDGTGVRDYIHVVDLARGHVQALEKIREGVAIYNLGTGIGTSVLELITSFSAVSGRKIDYEIMPRRKGDVDACLTNPGKANAELDWKAELSIARACADSWRWQERNPNGYLS